MKVYELGIVLGCVLKYAIITSFENIVTRLNIIPYDLYDAMTS